MIEIGSGAYDWFRALHVISVIAWMAGLLYLPRLYVYHCSASPCSEHDETLKVMERRLLRAIMNPAMISSFLFGGLMVSAFGAPAAWPLWLWVKLVCVVAMAAAHMLQARWRKDFEAGHNTRSHKFYRVANEVPTLLMIAVVILAVVEPF